MKRKLIPRKIKKCETGTTLPEVIVTPSYLLTEFFKINPNILKNDPKFFTGIFKDLKTRKRIKLSKNPQLIDNFYRLWELAGKPKIDNSNIEDNLDIERGHMDPYTTNISLYPNQNEHLNTAISELSHIFENNYSSFSHNYLEDLTRNDYKEYNIPGTYESKTHDIVEPELRRFVYLGLPSKYVPRKPITKLHNTLYYLSNLIGNPIPAINILFNRSKNENK